MTTGRLAPGRHPMGRLALRVLVRQVCLPLLSRVKRVRKYVVFVFAFDERRGRIPQGSPERQEIREILR